MRKRFWILAMFGALAVFGASVASAEAAPSLPLPGGKYVGKSAPRHGNRIVVRVSAQSETRTLAGVVRYPCAGVSARFQTDDGRFVALARRHGRTIFKAHGRFLQGMNRVRGSIVRLSRRLGHGRCRAGRFGATLRNAPWIHETTVSYGPFSVNPSPSPGHGGLNTARFNIEKPCEDCSLVAMMPDLSEADGRRANFDTGSMLHHVVLFNQSARDATCPRWGERFFASGNERSPFLLPRGYGYDVSASDNWSLITHLMNMGSETKDLYIKVSFYYVKGTSDLTGVKPFWLDINNCGNSEYETPAGVHTESRDFTVTPDFAGRVVSIGGHLHDHGTEIKAEDTTSGKQICEAQAGYDNDPSYMGHIDTVGGCMGPSLATLNAGDKLRLSSSYDAPDALPNVMGIMVGYVAPSG